MRGQRQKLPRVWDLKMIAQTVILAGATIGVLYGGVNWIEHYYAHEDDVMLIEQRLDEKIQGDYYDRLQQRIWRLEDRYGPQAQKGPESVREEYRQLMNEKQQMEGRASGYNPPSNAMNPYRYNRAQEKH